MAYVFVHLLPELSQAQDAVSETVGRGIGFLETHVYLVALLGLVSFYGLEKAALSSHSIGEETSDEDATSAEVFWLHIASFSLYNGLIGYLLLHRGEEGFGNLMVFTLAMALHFVVNDRGLREHHKHRYRHLGRWVVTGALVLGWAVGVMTDVSEAAVAVLIAFVSGAVVLNVLKEELPEERQSRFSAFALGATGYSLLLLLL
ncbi:MAG: hypothetical protein M3P51_11555 [Chloroflexota bacterium]|nr:hypothetical protein [Chloroflexota bacterium]